jgi:N-acetylneuraminic acid mutarotase
MRKRISIRKILSSVPHQSLHQWAVRTLLLAAICLLPSGVTLAWGQAACTNPSPVRPILFVHGWNEGTEAWGAEPQWGSTGLGIRDYVMSDLEQLPGYTNPYNYDLYFDGTNVRLSTSQAATSSDPIASSMNIPCNARFFSIRFYSWSSDLSKAFDPSAVMNVSIITKAYELSKVLQFITSLTYVKDAVIVAHSMGALDSRAYMEGMGSTDAPCTAIPCSIASSRVPYTGEVALLITLDGANAGSGLAIWAADDIPGFNTTNTVELEPGPGPEPGQSIIYALNYWDSYIDASGTAVSAKDLQSSIVAIISEYSDQMNNSCLLSTDQTCGSDNVVLSDSQSIQQPLEYYPNPDSVVLKDIPNFYLSSDPSIWGDSNCLFSPGFGLPPVLGTEVLHFLPCLADKHTSEGQYPASIIYSAISPNTQSQLTQITIHTTDSSGNQYSGPISLSLQQSGPNFASMTPVTDPQAVLTGPAVPVSSTDSYSLVYQSGGPTGAGTPTITAVDASGNTCSYACFIEPGNWSLTFNVSFEGSVSKPTATTQAATNVQGDGATLAGSVNPNGGSTTVWFEWGATNALGNTTAKYLLGSGNSALSYTKSINGLASNSPYYFRIDASNSAGTSYGPILSFTTLPTLPKPTLLAPQDGAANTSTAPQFSWTAVSNASSYRIIVATNAAALPTDPTSSTCGSGCLINQTPTGTTYSPPPGVLSAETQYFWEVHARSPLQYGDWSLVSSFTAGQPSSFALSNGGPVTVSPGNSGTTALTVTPTGGFTGQVNFACAVSGSPTGLTCSAPSASVTGASSTSSTLTVGTAATTPTGTYTAMVTASDTTGKITASTTVSITVSSAGKTTPTVSVTPLSTSITTAQPLTVNVSVYTSSGPSPTGTVTVTIGSYTSTATPLVNASAAVIIPAGSLSAGTYTATATYSGDSNFNTASGRANNSVTVTASASGIAEFTASSNTLTAGDSVTFTVTLSADTASPTLVYLTSSATSVLPSGSITVPAGSNSGTGVLTSSSTLTQSSQAVITASLGGVPFPQTQTITVNPITGTPTITAFYASTNTVTAGGSVSFTVSLSSKAPPGTTVSLSSSATSVMPNASIAIPAGSYGTGTLVTSSSNVTQPSNAVITASLGGVPFSQTRTITVNPVTIKPGDFVWTNYGVAPDTLCDGAASVVLNNLIYVFGVGQQCQGYKFDPAANTWTQLPAMPAREFEGGAAAINGKIYAVDGAVYGNQLQIYDPATNQWTTGSSPITPQTGPAIVAANGMLYDIGGYNNDATASVVQEYNPQTDSWTQKTNMPTPRGYATAATFNGIIYVIGGRTANISGAVEAYDPVQDTWTTGEQMIDQARCVMASAILNNKLYLIGGSDNGPDALSVVQEYDPSLPIPFSGAENQWRDMNSILTARRGAVAGTVNGTVYVIGGTDGNGIALTSIEQGTYIPPATPTVTMSPGSTSITTAQDLSEQVIVSAPTGASTPTGSVVLSGGGYTSQSQSLSGGIANFDIPAGKLAIGTDTLTATYTPDSSSSSSYLAAAQSVSITVSAAPSISLTSGGDINLTEGSNATGTLTVTPSGGFTGQVNFTCAVSGSPTGLSCAAPVANVTGTSATTSTLTVGTTAATPAGNYTATVTATDAATGKITASTTVSITVNAAPSFELTNGGGITVTVGSSGMSTLTVTPLGGFTGQVDFTCAVSGSPTGMSCAAPAANVTGTSATTSTLTVGTAATPAGNYTATVTATDAATGKITASTTVSITVNVAPSFLLSAQSSAVTITQGGSNTDGITVAPANGFTGSVSFSATGLPSGVTPSFNPNPTTANSSVLTLTATATAATGGPATVTITGTSGGLTASTTIALTVTAAPSLLAPTVNVSPANNGAFDSSQSEPVTVTVSGTGATPTGSVTLSGGGYTSPLTTLSSGSAVITIPANTFSASGNVTLTVSYSGDSAYTTGSGTANITVNPPYKLTTSTPSPVSPGSPATATITLSADPSYSGTVTLACTPATHPSGASNLPTCSVTSGSPVTVTNGIASGTATVTIDTIAATSSSVDRRGLPSWLGTSGGTALAFLIFFGIPARRRKWRNLLGLLIITIALGGLSACGGGGSGGGGSGGGGGIAGTTAGTYTFTVTGTGIPAITPAPAVTVTVTVN